MTDNFSFTSGADSTLQNHALECIAYLGKQFHKVASVEQIHHVLGLDSLMLTDPQLREAADSLG
ncbi:hypothetical protein KKI93_25520, partial [Xenorhabdus bovienii]